MEPITVFMFKYSRAGVKMQVNFPHMAADITLYRSA